MIESKIVWLLVSTLISSSSYALLAPFLPIELVADGVSSIGLIGVAFAAHPIAVLALTPLVTRAVPCIGNTNMISVAVALQGTIFIIFGNLEASNSQVTEQSSLLLLASTLRFVQGAACACVHATCMSMVRQDDLFMSSERTEQ